MTRSPLSLLWLMLLTALPTAPALSQEDETLAALDLADSAEFNPDAYQALNMMFEAASSINHRQEKEQRLSLDMRLDTPLGEKWRLVLSNRLDSRFTHRLSETRYTNTLREAWLSYHLTPQMMLDMGRINTRYGVALGYNPTDFLGRGTVRSMTSADPETLRNNRMGNGMVRLQHFWDNAAVSALWAPKIRRGSAQPTVAGQDPRRSVLLQAYWKDFFAQYDLNLIAQRDLQRHKNMGFAELRHHLGPLDVALQWQKIYLLNLSERRWQISLDYWL